MPAAISESKSMRTSISSAVSTFAEIPPGMTALSFRPPRTPSSVTFDQLPQGHADRRLVDARPVHMPAHREKPRAALFGRADAREAFGTFAQDERHASQRLDVVDDRRALEETRNCGERRLEFRKALTAFQRSEQGCLLAADISACARDGSTTSRSKPLPWMFLPSHPWSYASSTARPKRCAERKYSPRM